MRNQAFSMRLRWFKFNEIKLPDHRIEDTIHDFSVCIDRNDTFKLFMNIIEKISKAIMKIIA